MRRSSKLALAVSLSAHGAVLLAFTRAPKAPHDPHPQVESAETRPSIAGDTFELPAPAVDEPTTPTVDSFTAPETESEAPSTTAPSSTNASTTSSTRSHPRNHVSPSARGRADDSENGATGEGTLYGAVGDRSATDIAKTFARAFTQTASEDPAWQAAPLGSAGRATVSLTIDASGHIQDVQVSGSPSAALSSSIHRTMALVRSRTFTAHQRTTQIRLLAKITTGRGNDGLEEGRYGVAVHEGQASFVLPIGRRIILDVQ